MTYAAREDAVEPLDRFVAADDAVHAVDEEHELTEGSQYVVDVVVLFGVVGHLDETVESILVDKLVDKVLVILVKLKQRVVLETRAGSRFVKSSRPTYLKQLLEQEQRAPELGVLGVENFLLN